MEACVEGTVVWCGILPWVIFSVQGTREMPRLRVGKTLGQIIFNHLTWHLSVITFKLVSKYRTMVARSRH